MTTSEIQIIAKDGYPLSAILREPLGNPKAVIQIHCGMGIPKELYSNFASFLALNGYITLTFDYRGFGGSAPTDLKTCNAEIQHLGQLDMVGVLNFLNHKYPKLKKIVIAHSMGGQMLGLMGNNHLIDQIILIASSTGYWGDMTSPYKYNMRFGSFMMKPIVGILGYLNASLLNQGEDMPPKIALQWRKWCLHPQYFEIDFGNALHPLYFDQIKVSLTSIQIADDPLANQVTCNKLLTYFKNAQKKVEVLHPADFGFKKIGHAGYFQRKWKYIGVSY